MTKSSLNQWVKEKTVSWWSNLANNPTSSLLLLYIFLIPVQLNLYFWPSFSFLGGLRSDLLAPSLFATDVLFFPLFILSFPLFLQISSRIKVILIGCLTYFIVISLVASSPLLSFYGIFRLFQGIYLGFLLVVYLKNRIWREHLKNTIMASAFFVIIIGLFQYLSQHSLGGLLYFLGERTFSSQTPGIANVSVNGNLILRPYVTFPHPNVLGGFLVTVLVYILAITPITTLKKEKLTLPFLLLLFTSILFTFSRTSILVACGVIGYYVVKDSKKGVIFLTVLSILLLLLSLPGQYLFSSSLLEESSLKRIFLFQSAWILFTQHPFFGGGVFHFLPSLLSFSPTLPLSFLQPVHSLFALMLVEVGVIGVLVIVFLCKTLFTKIEGTIFSRLPFFLLLIGLGSMDHYLWTLHQGHMILGLILAGIFHTTGKKDQVRRSSKGNYSKRTKKRVSKISIPQP